MLAAKKSCDAGQPIHHEVGEITPEKVLHAMLAADAIGQARKANRDRTPFSSGPALA
jgi:glycerol dehydrogenase